MWNSKIILEKVLFKKLLIMIKEKATQRRYYEWILFMLRKSFIFKKDQSRFLKWNFIEMRNHCPYFIGRVLGSLNLLFAVFPYLSVTLGIFDVI